MSSVSITQAKMNRGSVIQANENAGNWCGCLLMVDEVKEFGVQAFVQIPIQGCAYIRLKFDQFDYVGEAPLVPAEEEE